MKLTLFVIVLGCPRASTGETAVLGTEAAGNWALQARAECCRPWVSRLFWTFLDPESFNYATLLDQIDTLIHFWFDERFEEKLKSTSCPGEHTLSLDPFISLYLSPTDGVWPRLLPPSLSRSLPLRSKKDKASMV